jgi:hypothetical protein
LDAAPRSAAVETIVDSNPTTPAQLLKAALLLADMDRLDLAKKYLAQLSASKPDENVLAESAGQIDPEMLLRVSAHPDLQPEGAQYASAILAAAGKLARDPARMMQQIDRLADSSRHEQHEAIMRIMSAHEDAVPALVKGLTDSSQAASHETVREILVRIGPPAVAPLVAALRSDDAALKLQVIEVIQRIGSSEAVAYLVAPAVAENSPTEIREASIAALGGIAGVKRASRGDAIQLLVKEIQRDLKHDRPITIGPDGRVTVWRWDAASGMPVREELPEQQAWAALAGRLAEDLLDIAPDDATVFGEQVGSGAVGCRIGSGSIGEGKCRARARRQIGDRGDGRCAFVCDRDRADAGGDSGGNAVGRSRRYDIDRGAGWTNSAAGAGAVAGRSAAAICGGRGDYEAQADRWFCGLERIDFVAGVLGGFAGGEAGADRASERDYGVAIGGAGGGIGI